MAEKVLSTQLSGEEVIEAIADSVKVHLRKIGYPLRANDAFDKFSAKISIEATLWDVGNPNLAFTSVVATQGSSDAEPDGQLSTEFEIPALPPNELRQATGQEIPVLTQDQQGHKVVKGVKYTRKGSAIKAATAVLLAFLMLPALYGQAKPAPATVEHLTHTETIARDAVIAEQNKASFDASQFIADVAKSHPGYHYDPKTNDLVKDEPVKKAEEPKK